MGNMGTILLLTDQPTESGVLVEMLRAKGFPVAETSSVLEAIRYLKGNDVCMVFATVHLNANEEDEFKSIVESVKPGVGVMFMHTLKNGKELVTMEPAELGHFVSRNLSEKQDLSGRIKELKSFAVSFAYRLIQVFGATGKYMLAKDHLVAKLARKTAIRMGLDGDAADAVMLGALLKDLGMLGIEHHRIDEKKTLTDREFSLIKKHPSNTVHILKQIDFPWNVDTIILQHHENYDGSGYPMGLKGRQIVVGARVVHIADSFIAMTATRPHRTTLTHEEAVQELIRGTGTKYDPEIVEAFLSVMREELPHESRRRAILVIEASPDITPIVKLSVDLGAVDITMTDNGIDSVSAIKKRVPDLIIADVEILQKNTIVHLFNTMYEVPTLQDAAFIFILPHHRHPRNFIGDNIRYITKPIDIDELQGTIRDLLATKTEAPAPVEVSTGIRGSLADFNLGEIIQILHMGLKTARVEVTHNNVMSVIHLVQGNIVHAANGKYVGKDAFFEMMRWEDGTFCIQHGIAPPEHNIHSETMHLLLEAARLQDEAAHYGAQHSKN